MDSRADEWDGFRWLAGEGGGGFKKKPFYFVIPEHRQTSPKWWNDDAVMK